jgi:hypothetical protein
VVPDEVVGKFAAALSIEINDMDVEGATVQTKGFDEIRRKVKEVVREGYSASQLLTQVSLETDTCLKTPSLILLATASRSHYRASDTDC